MYNIWLRYFLFFSHLLNAIQFHKKSDIYLNIHSNARNKRLYLESMREEVLSLPTFPTSVSYIFFKKACITFQNLLKDFLRGKGKCTYWPAGLVSEFS